MDENNLKIIQMSEVLKYINNCNEIKYASYRMASKVKIIQKALRSNLFIIVNVS